MFNQKGKLVKKWRNNLLPDVPIKTPEQLEVYVTFHNLIIGTMDKDMHEAGIPEDSPEGVELLNIRAGLVERLKEICEEFESGQ